MRHEEITDAGDLPGIVRALWAIEIGDPPNAQPVLDPATLTGDRSSYAACQEEAGRIRGLGQTGLVASSAALLPSGAHGLRVEAGMQSGPGRDGVVFALFGTRPDLVGWLGALGRPDEDLLSRVRHF